MSVEIKMQIRKKIFRFAELNLRDSFLLFHAEAETKLYLIFF